MHFINRLHAEVIPIGTNISYVQTISNATWTWIISGIAAVTRRAIF